MEKAVAVYRVRVAQEGRQTGEQDEGGVGRVMEGPRECDDKQDTINHTTI